MTHLVTIWLFISLCTYAIDAIAFFWGWGCFGHWYWGLACLMLINLLNAWQFYASMKRSKQ